MISLKGKLLSVLVLGAGCWMMSNFTDASQAEAKGISLKASNIEIKTDGNVKEDEIYRILPELKRDEIRVSELSKNIQLINDMGSMKLKAQFSPQDDGTYHATIIVNDIKDEQYSIFANNTGNDYTGKWRTGVSYTDTDLAKSSDAINVTYITSPDHLGDVNQVGITYKGLFPHSGDTGYVSFSHSDVDMGRIAGNGIVDLYATGKSNNIGFHYQHNITYTSAKKQILDVGIDYKQSSGNTELIMGGVKIPAGRYSIEEKTLGITYADITRSKNQAFAYTAGYIYNLDGDRESYNTYRTGADTKFNILKGSINYQYRTDSDWILGARVNGQWTNHNLISTEQIGIGGVGSVRGFKEKVASGDKGYVAGMEIYTPMFAPDQRFVLFMDAGHLMNNQYNIGESSKSISSYGIGYRFMKNNKLSVSIDWAKPIHDDNIGDRHLQPWHFSMSYTF